MCVNIRDYLESTSGPFYSTYEYSCVEGMMHQQTIHAARSKVAVLSYVYMSLANGVILNSWRYVLRSSEDKYLSRSRPQTERVKFLSLDLFTLLFTTQCKYKSRIRFDAGVAGV